MYMYVCVCDRKVLEEKAVTGIITTLLRDVCVCSYEVRGQPQTLGAVYVHERVTGIRHNMTHNIMSCVCVHVCVCACVRELGKVIGKFLIGKGSPHLSEGSCVWSQ